MATVTTELPGAAQFQAYQDTVRRRESLKKQVLETDRELRKARAELDRLASAALEVRDDEIAERDRINAMAETATARIRELDSWAGKLRTQLEALEKELPELRKQGERGKTEMIKAARGGHERAVSRLANGIREVLEGNADEERWRRALVELVGEETTKHIRPLSFLQNQQIEQSAEYWFADAKEHGYKI